MSQKVRSAPRLELTPSRARTGDAPDQADALSGQAQRLESLGQLAGGVAHDFNNLLAVILNYTSLVSEELAAASEFDWFLRLETAQLDLGRVTLAAERAAILTRQLLAFARQEVVRPKVLDVNRVVSGVEEMLRRTIGEQVELVASLADDLWPILADPGQLEQVLVNLAVNARDAMPAGRHIDYRDRKRERGCGHHCRRIQRKTGPKRAAAGQ